MRSEIDARCHNSEPGTFNHECGKPAAWIGTKASALTTDGWYHSGYCDECKKHGTEARVVAKWIPYQSGVKFNEWK